MNDTATGALVLVASFAVGSIPFANLGARRTRGVDLRDYDTGTVSGTSLYRVAGFGPLAVVGVLEVAKGSFGPLLAGSDRPVVAALAGGLAVAGHNWSPWLRGAGGRGISPALGALLVHHWPGTLVLALGLVAGRLVRQTGIGSFIADVALVPVLAALDGVAGALAAAAVVVPMLVKRVLGNQLLERGSLKAYAHRLVFDNDGPARP